MKPDKYRKRFQARRPDDRLRRQIATEAARRMLPLLGPDPQGRLGEATESQYYAAKCRAAAVLGHAIRPGDLPSDSEVREQLLWLAREAGTLESPGGGPEPLDSDELARIAEHLDRFDIYRMRLLPLEEVKQDPRHHPEGDALYHSLQVFERARDLRPYDEEFLLAALLHDVGKAIDPRDHVAAALEALHGTITDRTAWLIAHHHDLQPRNNRPLSPRDRHALESSGWYDDLVLLRELDLAGTAVGVPTGTVDDALACIKNLEHEHEQEQEPA
jgi:hypothetical protein